MRGRFDSKHARIHSKRDYNLALVNFKADQTQEPVHIQGMGSFILGENLIRIHILMIKYPFRSGYSCRLI